MGKVGKGKLCDVKGCGRPAVRSISGEKARGLDVAPSGRRVYLCEEHYKLWKKLTKRDRELDRLRFLR